MSNKGAAGVVAAVPSPASSLEEYLEHLQSCLEPLTRAASQLPGPSDLSFHRSLDRRLADDLVEARTGLVDTINTLVARLPDASRKGKARDDGEDSEARVTAAKLLDEHSFSTLLGDVVDTLLENTDTCIDEYQGKVSSRATQRSRDGASRSGVSAIPALGPLPPSLLNAPIRPLPQEKFATKPDNSRETIWTHSLTTKPHAKVPLSWQPPAADPGEPVRQRGVRQGMYCAEGDPVDNPYYYEISQYEAPPSVVAVASLDELQPPPPLVADDPTGGPIPFLWVHDDATFQTLYDHLAEERVKEIAIDVEHHNYRSYQGLVCLVQISTRWHDFIVDGLSPSVRAISYKLNDVMADPNRVKILHGAEHDILWLQRDLNIYIVGLFDTYHATNVLNFSQHGLAYLLQKYINFVADKRYQLADWRIRPLPAAMMYYARSDTHSLIHIYDCMRFQIATSVGVGAIGEVFELSKRTAAKTYAKEEWDVTGDITREGWRTMWKKLANEEAIGVDARWEKGGIDGLTCTERIFRALHDWRDRVARAEDESPRFVLSSAHMLNLASRAPITPEAVVPCVGQSFKRRSGELAQLIAKEKEAYAAVQERSAEIQREVLRQQQTANDEELGDVVERGSLASPSLWPETAPGQLQRSSSSSSLLAGMLFSSTQADAAPARKSLLAPPAQTQKSLFAPMSKTAVVQNRLETIRQSLKSALRGVIVGTKLAVQSASGSDAAVPAVDDNATASSAQDVNPVESSEVFERQTSPVSAPKDAKDDVKDDSGASAYGDVMQGVRKKKRDRKQQAQDTAAAEGSASNGKKAKKPRWTKEEKEARKAKHTSEDADIEPFDYSTAVSVLDKKPEAGAQTNGKAAVNKKGKDSKKSTSKGAASKSDARATSSSSKVRYSNVPVGRDRREQAGGKSMTFST